MCSDHPKFRARLQTISVKHTRAAIYGVSIGVNPKFSGQNAATADSRPKDYLEHTAVLPTGRLIQQFRFDVECRFDVHLRVRIGSRSVRLLGRCWPLREIARGNFHRRLRVGGRVHFASSARYPAGGAISPNGEQTIGIGLERHLACHDVKL